MTEFSRLDGLVPLALEVRSTRIFLDSLEIPTDIGFHDFEVGEPQRLLVSVEVWLEDNEAPADDDPVRAWDYDMLRLEVTRLASARRYNLQETLAHAIYGMVAARGGVRGVRVKTCKPDIYPDAHGVGVEIASFIGSNPG